MSETSLCAIPAGLPSNFSTADGSFPINALGSTAIALSAGFAFRNLCCGFLSAVFVWAGLIATGTAGAEASTKAGDRGTGGGSLF
jgi:hypothetical protein